MSMHGYSVGRRRRKRRLLHIASRAHKQSCKRLVDEDRPTEPFGGPAQRVGWP